MIYPCDFCQRYQMHSQAVILLSNLGSYYLGLRSKTNKKSIRHLASLAIYPILIYVPINNKYKILTNPSNLSSPKQ